MDIAGTASQLFTNFSWPTFIFAVLFLASEVLGAHPKVKTSSLFEVAKAMLNAFKDQVLPKAQPVASPEVAKVEPTVPPQA